MVRNGQRPEALDASQYVFDSQYVKRDPALAGTMPHRPFHPVARCSKPSSI